MDLATHLGGVIAEAIRGQFLTEDIPLDPLLPAVVLGDLPSTFPRGVGIMPFQVDANAYLASDTEGLQLRYRGQTPQVMAMREAVFQELQGLYLPVVPASANFRIEQVRRMSSGSLGYDASGRLNWSENYYVQMWKPTVHRL